MRKTKVNVMLDLADSVYDVVVNNIYASISEYFDYIYPGVNELIKDRIANPNMLDLTCTTIEGYDIIKNSIDRSFIIIKENFEHFDMDNDDPDIQFIYQWFKDLTNTIIDTYKDISTDKEKIFMGDLAKYAIVIQESKDISIKDYCLPYLTENYE